MTARMPVPPKRLDLRDLTIGYSSLAHRTAGIRPLPIAAASAEVVVCVQGGEASPGPGLAGARIVPVPGLGVARSRNAAIDQAGRDYLLFCDDDVVVTPAGVAAALTHLRRTGHALALGRALAPDGRSRKAHPEAVRPLHRRTAGRAATYEMLIDVAQVRAAGVRFDERFGAGMRWHLGDEFIFIADLLAAGLAADAVPHVFGIHPADSSGERWGTPADRHARAAAINRAYGAIAPLARTAFAVRHRRRLGGLGDLLRFVVDGTRA